MNAKERQEMFAKEGADTLEKKCDAMRKANETEATRVHREAAQTEEAYRKKQRQIASEAKEAAEAAAERVRQQHADELERLRVAYVAAYQARDSFIDRTASHPLEGRIVERTVRRGGHYSWNSKEVSERGRLEVRRKSTEFADSLWNSRRFDLPDMGALFIRRLKADGSDGVQVVTVSKVNDDGTIYCGGGKSGRGWHLAPLEEAAETEAAK